MLSSLDLTWETLKRFVIIYLLNPILALHNMLLSVHPSQRPRYVELRAVMTQIPNISVEALDQYEHRLLDPSAQKFGEKKRKDQFKKLIAGTVGVMPYNTTRGQCLFNMITTGCWSPPTTPTHTHTAIDLIMQVITHQCDFACVVNFLC